MFKIKGLDGKDDVKLLSVCKAPMYVFGTAKGARSLSSKKRLLHAKYVIGAAQDSYRPSVVEPLSEESDGPIVVEFDLCGSFVLNWPGELYLTDGNPEDTYDVIVHAKLVKEQVFAWHPLTAFVPADYRYTFPDYHSRFWMSEDPIAAAHYNIGPFHGWVGPHPLPIGACRFFEHSGQDATLVTEWFG